MSGSASKRFAVVTADACSLPVLMCSIVIAGGMNPTSTCPPIKSVISGPPPRVRHVNHVDSSHDLEQLACDMLRRPSADRSHVDLAPIGLSKSDELGNCLAGTAGLIAITNGDRRTPTTGAMS